MVLVQSHKRLPQVFIAACALMALSCALFAAQTNPPKNADIIDLENPTPIKNAEVLDTDTTPGPTVAETDLPSAIVRISGEPRMGGWMLLDASGSTNPKPGKFEFQWRQLGGPAPKIDAEDARQSKLWLYLTHPGEYRFLLRIRNAVGWSLPAEQKFSVLAGTLAMPENEGRQIVGAGERISLPGKGWRQVSGAPLTLQEGDTATCRPVRAGIYIFEAVRTDKIERRGAIVPAGRDPVIGGDRRPIAEFLTRNPIGTPGKPLVLDASLSYDPDGAEETKALKARWITPDKDRGVELDPLQHLRVRFKASRPGTYSVSLVVSDGRLESTPATVFVKIEDARKAGNPNDTEDWQPEPELEREDIRYRRVSLGLWAPPAGAQLQDVNLQRAVQLFPSRCGIALRVDSEVAPPDKLSEVPLNLEVRNGALMHLIDWISRQTDTVYRRQGAGAFWLTRPLSWAKEEKIEPTTVQVDALFSKTDGSDLMALLEPVFRPILQAREGTSLAFVQSRQELLAVMPKSACVRLKDICAALRAPTAEGLPYPDLPTGPEYQLRKTLAEKTVNLKTVREPVDIVLRDLAQASGISTAFDPRQFPQGLPKLDLDISNAPLRDALRTIVANAGFDGCSVEAPGGLWFYRGPRPYPSGEILWDHALIRAYDLSGLLQRITPISGEAVAHLIQSRIYPESWKDSGAAVFYHPPTRKLMVIHGIQAQNKVIEFLLDLAERGEWALGPAE